MKPTKTNQPRLPKGRVMYSHCSSGIIDVYDSSMGAQTSRNRFGYGDIVPCAVLPCRTAREAKAIAAIHAMHADLPALLQECDRVLTMIPHRGRDDGYMKIFGEEYVTPLIHKLRGTKP